MKKIIFAFICFFLAYSAKAQLIEDALRLNDRNGLITARAGSLGISYIGIANDGAAIFNLAAGLALIPQSEVSVGFGGNFTDIRAKYLDGDYSNSISNQYLSHFTLVGSIESNWQQTNPSAFGVGYMLENDFDVDGIFQAFNPSNSFINHSASRRQAWTRQLELADKDFRTPYTRNLFQDGFSSERGGLHNVTAAYATYLGEHFILGFSMSGKFGTYSNLFELFESDTANVYNLENEADLDYMFAKQQYEQDIAGFTASVSFIGKITEDMRLTGFVNLPTWYAVSETFSEGYIAQYDVNSIGIADRFETNPNQNIGTSQYTVRTPFAFGMGFSWYILGLTMSGAFEVSDASNFQFQDAPDNVMDLNRTFVRDMRVQKKVGLGAEYKLPFLPIIARGSYQHQTSPSRIDDFSIDTWALGIGMFFGESVRFDGTLRYAYFHNNFNVYGNQNALFRIAPLSASFGITYRY